MAQQPSWLLAMFAAVGLALHSAQGHAQSIQATSRELADIESEAGQLSRSPLQRAQLRTPTHVEERLTDGELLLRMHDYVRASVIFTDIVDNYPQHSAYPDALFLLAESLFKAGDFLGARARYRAIIEHAEQNAYKPFVQRALGRLIEIAIHIRDFEGVDDYFVRLSRLPPSEVEAATTYFRAKYLYSLAVHDAEGDKGEMSVAKIDPERIDLARLAFDAVAERSPYYAQARYFIGVVYVLRGQLDAAIDAFGRVARIKAQTDDERRVVELAQLAIGRLRYEQDQLERAIEAYQLVPSSSPRFETALYEIAWIYIRMGDATRAERALEVLSISAPDSPHIPDGKLLRGNLLLRDGQFNDATKVFKDVSLQFGPVRDELDRILAEHEDAVAYFKQLVRDNLEAFDVAAFLPSAALRWTAPEGEMQRGMETLSDLSQARKLVSETESVVARLNGALASPNPVNLFPDLRAHRERTVALRNRLARATKDLIAIDAAASKQYASAELEQVRARRRELERSLAGMPTGPDDIQKRSSKVASQYGELGKQLSRSEVDLLGMEARIAATDRFVNDTSKGRDPQAIEAVRGELTTHKASVADYRRRIKELSLQIETGRLQVGVGDQDFVRDESLRKEYAQLVERERQLLKALGAQLDVGVEAAFLHAAAIEGILDRQDREIDAIVAERVAAVRKVVGEESAKLTGYHEQLAALEGKSEDVVGGIALANFRSVRERFYDLVLRSDVGTVDVAWAVREEHRVRSETLTRERARALKSLEDEYRDIMDQQGGQ